MSKLNICLLPAIFGLVATAADVPTAPTYYKTVLPIFQSHCQECHRPGEIGPFSLMSYESSRPWAKSIRQAVLARKMPPWHADDAHSAKMANDRSLTKSEVDALVAWSDGGAPAGDPKDAPAARAFPDGWTIGKPDTVFDLGVDFPVPAKGAVEYTLFLVHTNFKEDRWVSAVEVRPSMRSVVHHIVVHVRPPGSSRWSYLKAGEPYPESIMPREAPTSRPPQTDQSVLTFSPEQDEWLGEYFPGSNGFVANAGQAKLIPAGSDIIFQMHYTPDGKATTDRSKLALIFAKEPPKERIFNVGLNNTSLRIPPGEARHRVDTNIVLPNDVTLSRITPHMHLRGSGFGLEVTYPTGEKETILEVPRFDFNWQMTYALDKARFLPKGTNVHMTAFYDNSPNNKYNPDPMKEIFWGEQSWDEMITGFFDMTIPVTADPAKVLPAPVRKPAPAQTASAN
ncbi:MAG: cytochrome c [Bryobacteraceae bacterium]